MSSAQRESSVILQSTLKGYVRAFLSQRGSTQPGAGPPARLWKLGALLLTASQCSGQKNQKACFEEKVCLCHYQLGHLSQLILT